MQKKDCLLIGKVIKTHGIHGELIIEINNSNVAKNIKESVHLEIEGLLVPFFIEHLVANGAQRFRTKFHWLITDKQALTIVNCDIYCPVDSIDLSETDIDSPHLLIDFLASDENFGDLGTIIDYIDHPQNPLLVVLHNKKEILIPYHNDLIKKINTKNKTIKISCPEGLIDLYLD